MAASIAIRSPIAGAFRQPDAPQLVARTLRKSTASVTELRGGPGFGVTESMPREDAYLVALQLRACEDHDLFMEQRHLRPRNWLGGTTYFFDLRQDPVADLRDPFHSLMLHLPRKILAEVAEEAGAPRIEELRFERGVGIADPVVHHLLSSLLAVMGRPQEAASLFVDHVVAALIHHVARVYGGLQLARGRVRGGLAPWQERRVRELLEENLGGDATLARLAAECGLSVRHFARAFQQSTGAPPHRWLLKRRVERAQELLQDPKLPLTEIALACGFADQSHFTRVFTGAVGVSPGAWRRCRS